MAGTITVKIVGGEELKRKLAKLDPAQNLAIMRKSLLEIAFEIQTVASKVMIVPGGENRRDKSPLRNRLTSRTGTLSGSIATDRTHLPGAVEVGTHLKYGAVHEFGGTFPVKAHTRRNRVSGGNHAVQAHTATFPPRPFMQPALARVKPKMTGIILRHWKTEGGL